MTYALDSSITSAFWPGMIALIAFLFVATLVLIALIFAEHQARTADYDPIIPIVTEPTPYGALSEPPEDVPVGTSIVQPREERISARKAMAIRAADTGMLDMSTTDPRMRIDLGSRVDALFAEPTPLQPIRDAEDIRPTSPAPLQSRYKVTLTHLLETARRLDQPSAGGHGAHYLPTGGYPIVQPKTTAQQAMLNQWQAVHEEYTPKHGVRLATANA